LLAASRRQSKIPISSKSIPGCWHRFEFDGYAFGRDHWCGPFALPLLEPESASGAREIDSFCHLMQYGRNCQFVSLLAADR
jgi:hypothetical protein